MDDSCAVCADNLEWVAYGACGHREVCSTCVVRLRFICGDRRCCICKTDSPVVFVTKALGDYTRMINDFSIFPSELREGQVGSFWYHEDTRAFFDDVDHYKMIKAMCRLSCTVCDNVDEQSNNGPKHRGRFRNIEQLKGHLYHRHRLLMCSLCLEGRKVFICEQKLYTRAQLNQHTNTGDSEVDGSESERGGFMGHPMCEFCKTPFYGDNELYSHMSTEHYTCHICQRQHPGQYEYYKNYDDLEIHFGREHYLCEDEACLAKKFIVFQTEAEMKRHNAMEHGGRMSRSKRNAALQIPTSFRYRRSNEQDNRRGRGRTFRREPADYELSMAIQASMETARSNGTFHDPSSSSSAQLSENVDADDVDPIIQPFESLATSDGELSSRYRQALSQSSGSVPLGESSFPPLPVAPSSSQQKTSLNSNGLHSNTMAARLRRQNNRKMNATTHSAPAWPATSRGSVQLASTSSQIRPAMSIVPIASRNSGSGAGLPSSANSAQGQARTTAVHRVVSGRSPWNAGNTGRITHSASAPNLADGHQLKPSDSDFPPVSAAQMHLLPKDSQALLNVEDVHTANKSLVEKMRSALDYDEDKYAAFKDTSGQYRQGLIDTKIYLHHVRQYGLSHLVLDLARLCPDVSKQKELVETYNASLRNDGLQSNGLGQSSVRLKDGSSSKKDKGKKSVVPEDSNSKDLADSIISTVRKLQSTCKPSEEEVEVLRKDGYRAAKGKSKVTIDEQPVELSSGTQPLAKLVSQNNAPMTGSQKMDRDHMAKKAPFAQDNELKNELGHIKRTNRQLQRKMQVLEEEKEESLRRRQALEEFSRQEKQKQQESNETSSYKNEHEREVDNKHEIHNGVDAFAKIQFLENELTKVLEANNTYKVQLDRLLSDRRNNQANVPAKSTAEGEVSKERYERAKSLLEAELRDIRERYFHMSLKYAEVETQREELIMKLKGAKNGRRWFS